MKITVLFILSVSFLACGCKNKSDAKIINTDSSLVNTTHLDHLYTPIVFPDGTKAAGIYIYSEAPDYHLVADSDEGFTCVDDVSRAALVYLRNKNFLTDTSLQRKTTGLLNFILEMQSGNGYFYNFLFPGNSINKTGKTSINRDDWWSWRALQTLTEAAPLIKRTDTTLAQKTDAAINKLLNNIRSDLMDLPLTTKTVNGIIVPQWLPAGSGTDQASILILSLINYCSAHDDADVKKFIRRLADGVAMMQQKNATQPDSYFLSWENAWHAYGNEQAYALLKAGEFLKDSSYINQALAEINDFYPWLLNNGMISSFDVIKKEGEQNIINEKNFEQIAYGITPMIFAATEAYTITGEKKYADIAEKLAAWFFGANIAKTVMYDRSSGRCLDGIIAADKVNMNSGAESTIEALLALQRIEAYPEIRSGLNKYITWQK